MQRKAIGEGSKAAGGGIEVEISTYRYKCNIFMIKFITVTIKACIHVLYM